jgi:hypothetical protein
LALLVVATIITLYRFMLSFMRNNIPCYLITPRCRTMQILVNCVRAQLFPHTHSYTATRYRRRPVVTMAPPGSRSHVSLCQCIAFAGQRACSPTQTLVQFDRGRTGLLHIRHRAPATSHVRATRAGGKICGSKNAPRIFLPLDLNPVDATTDKKLTFHDLSVSTQALCQDHRH